MNKTYCDICKKEVNLMKDFFSGTFKHPFHISTSDRFDEKRLDICNECMEKVLKQDVKIIN